MKKPNFNDIMNGNIYKAIRRRNGGYPPRVLGIKNTVTPAGTFVDGWRKGKLRVYFTANADGITNLDAVPDEIGSISNALELYTEQFTLDIEPETAFKLINSLEEKLRKKGYSIVGKLNPPK